MKDEYPDQEAPQGSYLDVIFAVIVLVASGFSTYTTYLGFSNDLPIEMSVAIAAIIGLGLVGMNFKIRQARIREGGTQGALVVFAMIFVFSFLSNTNAFYSLFVEQDIVRETQDEAWRVYERESSRALNAFDEDRIYQDELNKLAEVENEMTKLVVQITDPRNLGLGEKAKRHLERIEELLETKATPLEAPPAEADADEHRQYADALVAHIRTLMAERSQHGVVDGRTAVHDEIRARRARHLERIEASDYQRQHTDEMKRDLKWTESQVNRWIEPNPPLVLDEINDEADEVGKFKYTWRNFTQWISPVAIVLAVILGALLDIIGPAMSFGLYRPHFD